MQNKKVGIRVAFFRGVALAAALAFLPSWASVPASVSTVEAAVVEAGGAVDSTAAARKAAGTAAAFEATEWSDVERGALNPKVLELALNAASCAIRSGDVDDPETLTVIDYSRPSTQRRMWVFDVSSRELLYEELVSHGQGSGANIPTRFSNQPDSHQTSIGLFVTDDTYVGRNGYSLRMNGLDRGFNDKARERAIVIHGAPYVSEQFAKATGRLGRSHGCPALREAVARKVIDTVKGGGLVFSYYPDQRWLQSSRYLGACGN